MIEKKTWSFFVIKIWINKLPLFYICIYALWTYFCFLEQRALWVDQSVYHDCHHDSGKRSRDKRQGYSKPVKPRWKLRKYSNGMDNKPPDWSKLINQKGEFVRLPSSFRNWVTADGSSGFAAEPNRYHLYVSLACPWAHRTLIVRKLKGLEDVISFTVVDWFLGEEGWSFTDSKPKCTLDTLNGCRLLREVYRISEPGYTGRVTVPVLWDKQKKTVVNNESSEIIRMLNKEFNAFCATEEQKQLDLYPDQLKEKIEELNGWIYPNINNGVYRSGFATSQEAYDGAVKEVFNALDKVEAILSKSRYLTGNTITEADVRLFTTLVRFDMVYVGHFKCNKKRIMDYPNMWGYLRDLFQTSGIGETVDPEHIQKHYQQSHLKINPYGIVAIGPDLDFNKPHGRQ